MFKNNEIKFLVIDECIKFLSGDLCNNFENFLMIIFKYYLDVKYLKLVSSEQISSFNSFFFDMTLKKIIFAKKDLMNVCYQKKSSKLNQFDASIIFH
jgi:hypothetical protein